MSLSGQCVSCAAFFCSDTILLSLHLPSILCSRQALLSAIPALSCLRLELLACSACILSCLESFFLRWEGLPGISWTFTSVRNHSGFSRSGLLSLLCVSMALNILKHSWLSVEMAYWSVCDLPLDFPVHRVGILRSCSVWLSVPITLMNSYQVLNK